MNRCMFVGHAGKDAELRFTKNGKAYCKFQMAVKENYKGADGEWHAKTTWIPVVVWGKAGEKVGEALKKGDKVFVDGRFSTEKWDKGGTTQYYTQIIASRVELFGGSGEATTHEDEPF